VSSETLTPAGNIVDREPNEYSRAEIRDIQEHSPSRSAEPSGGGEKDAIPRTCAIHTALVIVGQLDLRHGRSALESDVLQNASLTTQQIGFDAAGLGGSF